MALSIIDANVVLDVYDHDVHTSSTKLKAIALDCNTRFISAAIRKSGNYYDIGSDTEISLTIIRPDGNGVKIIGESTPIHITEPDGSLAVIYGAYAELTQSALAVAGNLRAQFIFTSGEQALRTEIFTIICGEALDAGVTEWIGDVDGPEIDGYNLETMTQRIATNARHISEITSAVTELQTLEQTALEYKGIYPNDADISNITKTGIYLLTGNSSSPTRYGTLIHLIASDYIKIQILYELVSFNIYYRRSLNGVWDAWQSTDTKYGDAYKQKYPQSRKYIAFGDSLMWGALWNGTSSDPVVTQAPLGKRIPDRICNAVRCDTYENLAIGGMAYTHENGSIQKMIDWIKAHDISGANLITIAGGRNDGSAQLGTSSSASGDGTICGAIREIVEYIRQVNAACQIVVIQVTPYTSANSPWTATSTSGWTLNSYDTQVKALCQTLNVGYASWYGCSLFSRWSDFSGGGGNWAHMRNAEQYVQMGDFIAGQVCKYYQN